MSAKLQQQLKQNLVWRGLYFIAAFASTVFSSRVLQAEASGEFAYLIAVLSFFVLIGGLNLDSTFTYFSASKKIEPAKLMVVGFIWILIVICIFSWLFSNNFYSNLISNNKLQINVYQCSMYYLFGMFLINYSVAIFYGLGDFKTSNLILTISCIVYMVCIGNRNHSNANLGAMVQDFCTITFVTGIILIIILSIKYKFYLKFNIPNIIEFKQIFVYTTIILLSNLIFFFVYRLDYFFVKNWCSSSVALGNYLQVSKLGQVILIVPQILAGTIFPLIAKKEHREEVIAIICKLARLFSVLFLGLFIITFIIGKWFFPWLFGETFTKMYYPMLIIIPGIYFLALSSLFSAYFSGTKNNKINLIGALIAIIVTVCLSFVLKSHYSIYIAALISSIAYFTESVYVGIRFKSKESIKLKEVLFLQKEDIKWFINMFKKK